MLGAGRGEAAVTRCAPPYPWGPRTTSHYQKPEEARKHPSLRVPEALLHLDFTSGL